MQMQLSLYLLSGVAALTVFLLSTILGAEESDQWNVMDEASRSRILLGVFALNPVFWVLLLLSVFSGDSDE